VPVALREQRAVRDVVMGVHKSDGTLSSILVNVEPISGADGVDPASVVCSAQGWSHGQGHRFGRPAATSRLSALVRPPY